MGGEKGERRLNSRKIRGRERGGKEWETRGRSTRSTVGVTGGM